MGKKGTRSKSKAAMSLSVADIKSVTDTSHVQNTILSKLQSIEKRVQDLTEENSRRKRNEERQAKDIHDLRIENKRLKNENDKLHKLLDSRDNPPKDSMNSSVPPSKDSIGASRKRVKMTQSLRAKSDKKVGGQPGHKGSTLHQSEKVDRTESAVIGTCPDCGQNTKDLDWGVAERRQVIDLIFPRAVVTEFLSLAATCPRCGRKLRTPFPEGVNAPVCYGPNIQALVAYLSEAMCISVCRIKELFSELFGIKMSEGTICNIIQAVKRKGTPAYKAIHDMIEHEKVVGADETGENINGALRWLWTFQSRRLTYVAGGKGRGPKDFDSEYPNGLPESTLVTDRLEVYYNVVAKGHQICLVHLLRNLEYLNQIDKKQTWSRRMQELLREAIRQRKHIDWQDIARSDIKMKFEKLLEEPLNKLDDLFGRLQRSLRKWKDAVFAFLYNPDLPSDNNGSERAIRKTKIKMKVSQCFRSEKGEEAFAVLHSLMETAKKNGQSAFNVLRTIASTGQWTPDCAR